MFSLKKGLSIVGFSLWARTRNRETIKASQASLALRNSDGLTPSYFLKKVDS
jgi:hypothetical protein